MTTMRMATGRSVVMEKRERNSDSLFLIAVIVRWFPDGFCRVRVRRRPVRRWCLRLRLRSVTLPFTMRTAVPSFRPFWPRTMMGGPDFDERECLDLGCVFVACIEETLGGLALFNREDVAIASLVNNGILGQKDGVQAGVGDDAGPIQTGREGPDRRGR